MGFSLGALGEVAGPYASTGAATALVGYDASKLAKPGRKPLPPVPPMPDITSTTQAQQLAEAKAAALRQGRAATILTTPQTTGDRLGP